MKRRLLRSMRCACGDVLQVDQHEGERIDLTCPCGKRHVGIITADNGRPSLLDIPLIDWAIAHLGA